MFDSAMLIEMLIGLMNQDVILASPPKPSGSPSLPLALHVSSSSESDDSPRRPHSHNDSGGSVSWGSSCLSVSPADLKVDDDIDQQLSEALGKTPVMRRRSVGSVDTGSSTSLIFEMSGSEGQRSESEEETSVGASGGARALPFLKMPSTEERMDSLSSIDSASTVVPEVGTTYMMDKLRRWRDVGLVETELLSVAENSDVHVLPDPSLDQPVVLRVVPVLTGCMNAYFGTDDLPSKEPFVVKIEIDPVTKKRSRKSTAKHKALRTEADILRDLSHENIVRFIKSDSRRVSDFLLVAENKSIEVNQHVLIMEYAGVDLRQYLSGRPHQDVWNCLPFLAVQLMQGLEYLEESEIVHCDIKPDNVLVGGNIIRDTCHCLKIADFGFAYNAADGFRSREDEIEGSLHFMAPELKKLVGTDQIQPQTYASDLYSAGITLAVILLEHHIISSFYRVESGKSVQLELKDEYRKNPLAGSFVSLVQKLLNKTPESRPTAKQASIDFLEVFDQYSGKR